MTKGGRPRKPPTKGSRGERRDDVERKRDERAKRIALRKERQAKEFYSLEDDENYVSFKNQLQAIGLRIKDIPGDGNCLFRALADQLEGDHNRHGQFRRDTVHYMRGNRNDFEPFYDGETTFSEYLGELEREGTYAGNDAIVAFVRNNNVDVVIHQYNNPRFIINAPINPKNIELHLAYHNGEHYSSLRRLNDTSDGPAVLLNETRRPANSQMLSSKPKKNFNPKIRNASNQECTKVSAVKDLLENEKMVMESTQCEDISLIRQSLDENNGDVDCTIAYLLQLMSLDETQEEKKAEATKVSHKEPECNSCELQCKCCDEKENGKKESQRVAQLPRKKAAHLSNRQRKELAKQEKKKRREEAQRSQANFEVSDQAANEVSEIVDDLGAVAI